MSAASSRRKPAEPLSSFEQYRLAREIIRVEASALESLAANGWLRADARVVVELAAKDDLALPAGYALERERRYGRAKFLFLRART